MFGTFQTSRQPLLPMRPVSLGRAPIPKNVRILKKKIENMGKIILVFKKGDRWTGHGLPKFGQHEDEDGHPGLHVRADMGTDHVAVGSLDWERIKDDILKENIFE
jgi:hypothetical protein